MAHEVLIHIIKRSDTEESTRKGERCRPGSYELESPRYSYS